MRSRTRVVDYSGGSPATSETSAQGLAEFRWRTDGDRAKSRSSVTISQLYSTADAAITASGRTPSASPRRIAGQPLVEPGTYRSVMRMVRTVCGENDARVQRERRSALEERRR